MGKTKWSMLLSLVLVLSMFLAACSDKGSGNGADTDGDKDSTKSSEPQVLNLLQGSEIPSMDSKIATDSVSFDVMNQVFEGLYRLDKDNKPTPGVAKSYDVSKDGLTYTFHLNENAKWSNGEPVTAADFVYAWKKVVDPETAAEYAYIMGPIKNANAIAGLLDTDEKKHELSGKVDELGVKAIDEHTLEVQLAYNAPYFIGLTSFATFYPQNQKFVEAQGDQYGLEADKLIYNGPFVLASWEHEEGWQLKPNEQYWDKETVKLTEVNYKIIKDTGTGVNLFETNQADIAPLSQEFVDMYKDSEDFVTVPDTTVYFLRLNQKNEVLKNVNARKALDMAWDKKSMVDVILNDGSTPAYYLVPGAFTFSPDGGKDFREQNGNFGEYNPEKAKELWETALKELGKTEVTLELLNYDSDNSKKVGEYIQGELQENLPGLTVTIKPQPFKQKLELESNGDYDFSYAGWGPDYQDPLTFLDMFVTNGAHNQMDYSDPKYDELIEAAITETDVNKRWNTLLEAEKLLFEQQPISPMFQNGNVYLQQEYVKNYIRHPFGAGSSLKWVTIEGKK